MQRRQIGLNVLVEIWLPLCCRRAWRYPRCNQKLEIEEQTKHCPKEKGKRTENDLQNNTHTTKDWAKWTALKPEVNWGYILYHAPYDCEHSASQANEFQVGISWDLFCWTLWCWGKERLGGSRDKVSGSISLPFDCCSNIVNPVHHQISKEFSRKLSLLLSPVVHVFKITASL